MLILLKFKERLTIYMRFIVILGIFLFTRILLTMFDVGIFPNLVNDVLFYLLAFILGMLLIYLYVVKIESKDLKEFYWIHEKRGYSLLFGILGALILLLLSSGFMMIMGPLNMNIENSIDGIIVAILFGLGAIYEEIYFRGILQDTIAQDLDEKKAIIIQAFAFLAIHLFYLPFDGFGMYYWTILLMGLLLGSLPIYLYY